jgi:T5SS/PEP-CTERM-associated repeat protein
MQTQLCILSFAAFMCAGVVMPLHAQLVADGATTTLNNVTNNITGEVTVGTNGSFTLLVLSDNVLLTNSTNGLIGRNATARSNEVRLASASARWLMGNDLHVGSNGALNRLIVSNGALVGNRLGSIGTGASSSNNVAVVTGSGSVWSNANDLFVGLNGRGNQLLVSNGGTVLNNIGEVGRSSTSNNIAVVTGPGSLWNNASDLFVGRSGSGNQLVVSNGATVFNISGYFSVCSCASSNMALVTGPGSVWTNALNILLGDSGSGNRLIVSNGGVVQNRFSYMGFDSSGSSSNNVAVVTGSGSLWNNANDLFVGYFGGRNQLVVSNGGTVFARNAFLGVFPIATNNRIEINGGSLLVSNGFGTGTLDLRGGTNVFNAGLIEVGRLLLTNTQGVLEFNGGALTTGGTSDSNGRVFTVGNGMTAAKLDLRGGTHLFANNLVIVSNASLVGNGSITGTVTVQTGGTLAPGSSVGALLLNNSPNLQGATIMEIGKSGSLLTNDQIQVAGILTYGGSLTVSKIGPTVLAAGDRFQLFSAGGYSGLFAALSLPPLDTGLGWTNRLLVDGSIEVIGPPPLGFAGINLSGTNVIITGTNGGPNTTYTVLTSTNVALPLSNWVSIATYQFGPGGDFSFTNVIDPETPQRFFRIRTP